MRKEHAQYCCKKIRLLFALCISFVILPGCSLGQNESTEPLGKGNIAGEESEIADADEEVQSDPSEDMVRSPIDFEQLNNVNKEEENGIAYYDFHTTRETPLPLNEWAKLDIPAENGATVSAYLRFTSITRDTEKIQEHMKQYFEANNMPSTFAPQPVIANDEYVLMKYDVLIGENVPEESNISLSAVRFPLQLYSTMRNGNFGDDTVRERENLVTDVSVYDVDMMLAAGTAIEKAVLCSVPKGYTAYGIVVPYMNAEGSTSSLYFKLEY